MGLFEKKFCDICGQKIGLFSNNDLSDGHMCDDCADQLSPWCTEYEELSIQDIKDQLEYREENKKAVADFAKSREIGEMMKVILDEDAGTFMVTEAEDEDELAEESPDVISFDDVTECNLYVDDEKEEIFWIDDEGNDVSYDPKRYDYSFEFRMEILLDHPFIDAIEFQLNEDTLDIDYDEDAVAPDEVFDPEQQPEYIRYMDMADAIIDALASGEEEDEDVEEEPEKETDDSDEAKVFTDSEGKKVDYMICPYCGSRSKLTYAGRCENCGGNLYD